MPGAIIVELKAVGRRGAKRHDAPSVGQLDASCVDPRINAPNVTLHVIFREAFAHAVGAAGNVQIARLSPLNLHITSLTTCASS